jgi:hypothetical protein
MCGNLSLRPWEEQSLRKFEERDRASLRREVEPVLEERLSQFERRGRASLRIEC